MSGQGAPHVLREYALLADGERGVLVGPRGEFAWMCFPNWHCEPFFSSLVGGPGRYSITPCQRFVWGGWYEPSTLIWHSRWVGGGTVTESREALALPARGDRAVVLRRVLAREGPARVRVLLAPGCGWTGREAEPLRRADDGSWQGTVGETHVRWCGAQAAQPHDHGGLELELELQEGQSHDLVLVLADSADALEAPSPDRAWQATEAAWRERVPALEDTIAPRDARHAYAVMTGLTAAAGGMVAAATTSLPERAESGRNYDYRYVWIRDQCYGGASVARAGAYPLLDDAVGFVCERLLGDGADLRPAYTVTGGRVPDERHVQLPGYPGADDVRVGNWVNEQFQLDAFGEALQLLAAAGEHDHLDPDRWRAAEIAAAAIEARWTEPDAGVWELDPAPWTHSRLSCAAGLRAISRHAPRPEQAAGWVALADAIVADTAEHALHRDGRWQRTPDDSRCDAALLMGSVRGALGADDPRSIATLDAVLRELTEDGFCYRFRPDDQPLGESEGAFLLCGFWVALALAQRGDAVGAARWFERSRSACGPPGLLAEEFDVRQRQLRGNLPQAFVHALLLECAATLAAGATPAAPA